MTIDFSKMTQVEFKSALYSMKEDERRKVLAIINRQHSIHQDPTPGHLQQRLDMMTIQTPALQLIDQSLLGVRDAIQVMYERRSLLAEMLTDIRKKREPSAQDIQACIEKASLEIPNRGITRLIISLGPQEGKSSRVSRYGIEWLLRQFPSLRLAIVSYADVNAGQFSYQIRSDIELFNGKSDSIDLGLRLMHDEKAKSRFQLTTGGGVYAVGVGGSLTGRPLDGMILDDPVKDNRDAESSLKSDNSWDWWQTVGKTRLAPGAPVVLVMTRWHEFDLAGRFQIRQREDEMAGIRNHDKWTVINIPAQADHDPKRGEKDPLGRKPGEFMVSARGRTVDDWEAIKNGTDPRFWNALYQGRPAPESGTIFLKEWWGRTYDEAMWTKQPDGTFRVPGYDLTQSWDFAFKDKKDSDYVVGQVWAKKGADSYLIYQVRARLSFVKSLDAIRRVTRLFPQARMKIIEDKANGTAIVDALKHEVHGIVTVSPDQSKEARAKATTYVVRAGNIHLPTSRVANLDPEIAWSPSDFIVEATSFPNGANDDQVDAMTQFIKVRYIESGEAEIISPTAQPRKPKVATKPLTPMQKRMLAKSNGEL